MISDFFHPNCGGVENHIFQLATRLAQRDHKVIIITHSYAAPKLPSSPPTKTVEHDTDDASVRSSHQTPPHSTRHAFREEGFQTEEGPQKYCYQGVRWINPSCPLKVYYLPFRDFYHLNTFPSGLFQFPLIRHVLLRERVDLIHAHSAFSSMAMGILVGRLAISAAPNQRGPIPAIFTDHSLFGFADLSSILTNNLLSWALSEVHCLICVSHISKENTMLRARLAQTASLTSHTTSLNSPTSSLSELKSTAKTPHDDLQSDSSSVFVIPNAIDTSAFLPDPAKRCPNKISIVFISRLVYRKGVDLLVSIIPKLCEEFGDRIQFLIGGDGPKRLAIEEIRDEFGLHDSIHLFGSLPNNRVAQLLNRGDIFLNTSLTEAFCIAIVEAASCGLRVVSTNVGGIPEVLPDHIISLCDTNAESLHAAVRCTVAQMLERGGPFKEGETEECGAKERELGEGRPSPEQMWAQHELVTQLYHWEDIAQRTEIVYHQAVHRMQRVCAVRPDYYSRASIFWRCILRGVYGHFQAVFFLLFCLVDYFCGFLNAFNR